MSLSRRGRVKREAVVLNIQTPKKVHDMIPQLLDLLDIWLVGFWNEQNPETPLKHQPTAPSLGLEGGT